MAQSYGKEKNMTEVVQVEGLSKSYGPVCAVSDLSFTVHSGEIFGIVGPNGAGKTTSIECILGTRRKDSGIVRMLGMDPVRDRRAVYAQVGVQFQDSAWQMGIRVHEICRTTACLYDPEPEWKPLLEHFDLMKRYNQPVAALSGGERQKLSILLACMHKSRLVFLDELTTGLDPLARREVWKHIEQLRDGGTAVVMSSHYMDEVENLCSRGLMLKNGRCVAIGSIADLVAHGGGKNLDESYINVMGA